MSPIGTTDRTPRFAGKDEAGRRYYTWKGESFYSVTTIIGGGVPKYLVAWAAKAVADLAYADVVERPYSRPRAIARRWSKRGRLYVEQLQAAGDLKSVKLDRLTDEDLALRWLKGQPDRIRDAAAELGSDVHSKAEAVVLAHAREASRLMLRGAELPEWTDDVRPHMESFVLFTEDWGPIFVAAEATVFHRPEAYAGTLDAILQVPTLLLAEAVVRGGVELPTWLAAAVDEGREWVTLIVDYKSGRAVYPEVALQLASYSRGQFVAGADGITEHPVPHIDGGAVLHLTPTGYAFRLVDIGPGSYQAFLYAREIFRWAIEQSRGVLSKPLNARDEEAA